MRQPDKGTHDGGARYSVTIIYQQQLRVWSELWTAADVTLQSFTSLSSDDDAAPAAAAAAAAAAHPPPAPAPLYIQRLCFTSNPDICLFSVDSD